MSKKSCLKKGCGCLLVVAMVIAIVLAVVAYLSKPKWHDEYGSRYLDVSYGSRPHNTYDLYLPTDATTRDSLALILYVHGGSWIGGDKAEHAGDCYAWVQKGYATATMNYSLLKEENTSLVTMLDEPTTTATHCRYSLWLSKSAPQIFAFCSPTMRMLRHKTQRTSFSVVRASTSVPTAFPHNEWIASNCRLLPSAISTIPQRYPQFSPMEERMDS